MINDLCIKNNLIGAISIMKAQEMKPNFAALAREYGMDWRTVKKYYHGYKGKPSHRDKSSQLDPYKEKIREKLEINRVTMRGVYEAMVNLYGVENIGTYSNFQKYVKKHKLRKKVDLEGNPRFEGAAGKQAQCDWKENITLHSKSGERFNFNVFHLVLKFSRFSYLGYSRTKESYDVRRCLINAFNTFGGVPKEVLFDNMPTVVNVNKRYQKSITKGMSTFAKEFNFSIKLCKVRHPKTKGCVEARNKIIDWIRPYDCEFETEEELIKIIEKINRDMNIQVCQGTSMSPISLFYKEKEYLSPLPSNQIIGDYLNPHKITVDNGSMIYYKGNRYSVRKELIGKTVSIEVLDQKLYIYYRGCLETCHPLCEKNINYQRDHYEKLMVGKVSSEDMQKVINNNLNLFDSLLEDRKLQVSPIKATKSEDALLAFLSQNSSGKWIINNYRYMNETKRKRFVHTVNEVLPYVDEECINTFLGVLQEIVKDNDIDNLTFDCLISDVLNDPFLTEEGTNALMEQYEKEYLSFMEDLASSMHEDSNDTSGEPISPEDFLS